MEKIISIFQDQIYHWMLSDGWRVLVIIIATFIINKFSVILITKFIRKVVVGKNYKSQEAEEKREDTLIKILSNTERILIWVVAVMMIMSELGIAIAPLLAAAGVAGIAFGFGGQYLIKDLISGLFIIFENQYRVGDVIKAGGVSGMVEDITLRLTTIRDLDGVVHHIPHGEITVVSNMAKEFSRINLNVGVAYDTNLEKLISVVNAVGDEMAADSKWKDVILSRPQFLRVDSFGDSSIDIKILGETKPLKQWEVTGELRMRLKIAFDREGIEIPFPQRVIHNAK